MSLQFRAAADQLTGPRAHQNDSYYIGSTWAVVADGVGSDPSSRRTADVVVEHYASIAEDRMGDVSTALLDAPDAVARLLANELSAGSSTVAAAILDSAGLLWLVGIGDSRFALVRDGGLLETNQLHNRAEYSLMLDATVDVPAEASSALMRALGPGRSAVPEIHVVVPRIGDTVVLLSDGVDAKMSLAQLVGLVGREDSPETICQSLLDAATRSNLTDNATCIVAVLTERT